MNDFCWFSGYSTDILPYILPVSPLRDTIDAVKQSAALTLLRLLRASPDIIPMGEWTSRIIHLLNDQHMGVVTSATSLIEALVKKNPDEYKGCVSLAVSRLSRVSVLLVFCSVWVCVCVSWSRRTLMNTKAACRWLCPVSAGLA
jgi:hypothetical protein